MSKCIKSFAELAPLPAYELEYERFLGDIKSAGIVFRHKKSGARVAVISNDDENKVFCAGFRTPPENSTGVPHIIEHTVLCGSKNYPSRDPFMQLAKGSLNTFLNAMTYPDKTLYPVASCNDKDFKNLMNVYMDAVFYPNIYRYKEIFMQEGWHYELDSRDGELTVNGVVYNEMKGALTSADRLIYSAIDEAIFPDNTYGVNSGGDPEVIPSLTYEYYLNFHRTHYHPSNSYIFLYGDIDVEERLQWMDEHYLRDFDKIEVDSAIKPQTLFGESAPRQVKKSYSVGSTDSTDKKTYYAFGSLCDSPLDAEESMAWDIISEVLIWSQGSPVKEALFGKEFCTDVSGGMMGHMLVPAFTVVAKNCDPDKREEFYSIIRQAFEKAAADGLNKKSLLAAINRGEFNYREADFGSYPKGLAYVTDMLQSWLYDDKAAFDRMNGNDCYASLRAKIDTDYYEQLIKKRLLGSVHSAVIELSPEKGLIDRKNEELKLKLAARKAAMSDEEADEIIEATKKLREYQGMEPTEEELNCIPSLARSDIKREAQPFVDRDAVVAGKNALRHDVDTNGITYVTLMFDVDKMPQKYIPYMGVLGSFLGGLSTDIHSYADLSDEIKINAGSLWFGASLYRRFGKIDEYKLKYQATFSVLSDKVKFALDTIAEIIKTSKFDDFKRVREILGELVTRKRNYLSGSGNSVASARIRSYYSKSGCYDELLGGVDNYLTLKELYDNFDSRKEQFANDLRALVNFIFNSENLFLSVAADEAGYASLTENLPTFLADINSLPHASLGEEEPFEPKKKNEGFMMATQVQYLGRGGNFYAAGIDYSGAYRVAATAVNYDYLYQNIRVKGGAYGCGCGFANDCGNLIFTSYRDPKLKETEDVYLGTSEFIRSLKSDEKELTKYIIGAFSGIERPMSPRQKADRSFAAHLTGKTYADVQKERDEMLDATLDDVKKSADAVDAVLDQGYICAVGNEQKLRDNAEMFAELIALN